MKRLVFAAVLFAMPLQLSAQTIAFLPDSDYEIELVVLDGQEESEQEEKQEDDSKDEKVEMQILGPNDHRFSFVSERSVYNLLEPLWDFSMEIPIPPPEQF